MAGSGEEVLQAGVREGGALPPIGEMEIVDESYGARLNAEEQEEYQKIHHRLVEEDGYDDGMEVHQICLLTIVQNRLRPHLDDAGTEKRFVELGKQISTIVERLEKSKSTRAAGLTVPKLFKKYKDEAKDFVKKHAGEFAFKCEGCGAIVTTDGLPLWAMQFDRGDDGEIVSLKWSAEVLRLYNEGAIPMHVAAYILRTSPKCLRITAEIRGEALRECDEAAEEALLQEWLRRDVEEWEHAHRDAG